MQLQRSERWRTHLAIVKIVVAFVCVHSAMLAWH
jgi:thiosulfate reductase cytochrome b subunit